MVVLAVCSAMPTGISLPQRMGVVGVSAILPLGMAVLGGALVWSAGRIRDQGKGAVVVALVAGVLLACLLLGMVLLFVAGAAAARRDLLAEVTPAVAAACLLLPAGKGVYHAVRVLALGARAGTRDRTSGLDAAVDATDEDVWRLARRVSLLHALGGGLLLPASAALLVPTLMSAPAPPPPEVSRPPQGTAYVPGRYDTSDGLPEEQRRRIVEGFDAGRSGVRNDWIDDFEPAEPLTPRQRQELDDMLREAGGQFRSMSNGQRWRRSRADETRGDGRLRGPHYRVGQAGVLCWQTRDGGLVLLDHTIRTTVDGDVIHVTQYAFQKPPRGWSMAARERWALRLQGETGKTPTVEQVDAVAQLFPVPPPVPDGMSRPPPVFAPGASVLDDGSMRVDCPDGVTRYVDANGSVHTTPLAQRQAEEAAAAVPDGPRAKLNVSPAWPLACAVAAAALVVVAARAMRSSGRGNEAAPLTGPAARRLFGWQTRLALAAAVLAAALTVRIDLHFGPARNIFISAPAALVILALGAWVCWVSYVLPRRVIALAR